MKYINLKLTFCLILLFNSSIKSQETLPIYHDYLSDNIFLLHPSAAGIGNTSKLRLTARKQWLGVPNAPALQTISFHSRFNEYSKSGYGTVLFNDKNGFHSQKGIQGSYAYHLPLSKGKKIEQLSFGLGFLFAQNQVDQTSFGNVDVAAITRSTSYYNADFSVAYHKGGLSSYFTVKNLLLTASNNFNIREAVNLRNYIFSIGYYYGKDKKIQLEPSVMLQLREDTGNKITDFNLKVYKSISKSQIWAAMSYRIGFDTNALENFKFITPIIGLNYKYLLFSYTYTQQLNDLILTDSGFHQITIGANLWTKEKRGVACPNINSYFGSF